MGDVHVHVSEDSDEEREYSYSTHSHRHEVARLISIHVCGERQGFTAKLAVLSPAADPDPHGQGAFSSRPLLLPRQGLQGADKGRAV